MKRTILPVLCCLLLCQYASAQKFDYNVDFAYTFDNYEYYRSNELYQKSYTLHAARISPTVGVLIPQKDNVFHRVMAGIDFCHDMGSGLRFTEDFKEFTLFYNLDSKFSGGRSFRAVAGIFPASFSDGDYCEAFISDDRRFTDWNYEGMFFNYRSPSFRAELGLDWNGMLGDANNPVRREKFRIFASIKWQFAGAFNLGLNAMMYHFACAPATPNVVDNHLLHPLLSWEPEGFFQKMSVDAGALISYQRDRDADKHPKVPAGFYSRQILSKWNVFVRNSVYVGGDLMPYYDSSYGGYQYGSELYYGNLAFHTRIQGASWHDCLSLSYEPEITRWLSVSVRAVFRFGTAAENLSPSVYRGCQQVAAVKINLAALRPSPSAPVQFKSIWDIL